MTTEKLIVALERMKAETGSLVCLGCGHEHNCDIHGCAIIRAAVERLKRLQWAAMGEDADAPPSGTEALVALRTGEIHRASYRRGHWYDYETRSYAEDRATGWMPLPEPPEGGAP